MNSGKKGELKIMLLKHNHIDKKYWLEKSDKFPWTRKELMLYLWHGAGLNSFNIFREGRRYVIMVGSTIYATDLNSLRLLSFSEWAILINKYHNMAEQHRQTEWSNYDRCKNDNT